MVLQINDEGPGWRTSGTRENVFTVTQVSHYLYEALENDPVLGDIWIKGELSNVSRSTNGHLYFTLKDSGGQLRCVMFRTWLTPATSVATNGAAVVAHGRFSFYEQRGDLQVKVDVLMPQGQGALHMEFERLKAKLETEGLFDQSRKRRPPEFPRRIAVITSPTGAVLQDILNVIRRRYPLTEVLVAPVLVQGENAAASIVAAFSALQQQDDVDVIILARGGGSIEELWPFNEEKTARAVFSSRAPVISAVGHETNFTIVDYVADLRAPTPSAAAELAVPNRTDLLDRISGASRRLRRTLEHQLTVRRSNVENARRRARRAVPDVDRERQRLDGLSGRALSSLRSTVAYARSSLERCEASLFSLDPQRTLDRGYAIVYRGPEREVLQSAVHVRPGDPLAIRVRDGSFGAVAGTPTATPRPKRVKPVPDDQLALFNG